MAIGSVAGRPFLWLLVRPVAIGLAIGHMQGTDSKYQSDSCIAVHVVLSLSKGLGCSIASIFEIRA